MTIVSLLLMLTIIYERCGIHRYAEEHFALPGRRLQMPRTLCDPAMLDGDLCLRDNVGIAPHRGRPIRAAPNTEGRDSRLW